jgi:hypothetical protein
LPEAGLKCYPELTFQLPFIISMCLYVTHFYTHIRYPMLLHTFCVYWRNRQFN